MGTPSSRNLVKIFILSAFLLHLEILLIRWVSTEIRVFAYFKNLTLIACFFGIGLGCMITEKKSLPFYLTYPLLTLFCSLILIPNALGFDMYSSVTESLGQFNEMPIWVFGQGTAASLLTRSAALALLLILFFFISLLFVPGGCLLGRLFNDSPHRIAAYSSNISGSLLGVWIFSSLSFMALPPVAWLATALVMGFFLLDSKGHLLTAAAASLLLMGLFFSSHARTGDVVWSPYQKLEFTPHYLDPVTGKATEAESREGGEPIYTGFSLEVNGTFFQRSVNLDKGFLRRHIDMWPEAVETDYMSYNLVYRLLPEPENVLVVGAGTGNDVAAALRNGAGHVDAVEIDPEIVDFGRRHHPEKPYSDARVSVFIDDARAFFKKTAIKYDLIVFGALDSHTLTSSLSNIRIDNYVYTIESFREVRDLLREDGMLSLVFSIERPFIASRIAGMLEESFGSQPVVFHNREIRPLGWAGGGPTFLVRRDGATGEAIRGNRKAHQIIASSLMPPGAEVVSATDDWPYLYLEGKRIPTLYVVVLILLLIIVAASVKPFFGEFKHLNAMFFFLGAAFLLVEVQSISKMALLFGTTWVVNSIVISGILTMILLSNFVAAKFVFPSLLPLFALLALSLLLNVVFPFHALLPWSPAPRGAAATLIMCLPIFFAGLIFILTFARHDEPHAALASNLLGAIAGGFAESFSFVIGINHLGLVALMLYSLSFLILLRGRRLRL